MLPRFLRLFSQDAKDAAETAPSEEPVAEAAAQLAAPPMVTPAAATNAETGPALGHHSFVRREPLLNRKQRVAAYEFSLKPRLASHMEESHPTSFLFASVFMGRRHAVPSGAANSNTLRSPSFGGSHCSTIAVTMARRSGPPGSSITQGLNLKIDHS